MLLSTSFAEVACNQKPTYFAIRTMTSSIAERFQKPPLDTAELANAKENHFVDPVPENERVPFWMWGSILIPSVMVGCVVMGVSMVK